jgi:hypothetical protein
MSRRVLFCVWLVMALVSRAWAAEEAPPAGPSDLKVTVIDQSGAALVIATVTLVDAAGVPRTVPVDQRGQAVFEGLTPGKYTLKAAAQAFQSFEGPIAIKKGPNAVTLNLPLAGLAEEVVVKNDTTDASGNGFNTSLSPQQIAELPDDPDELEQMLNQMAGPDAVIRVNGFRGGRLPPKSQIQQIRFRMNSYAADMHEAGGGFGIDIVTKPGMDGWRGTTNFGFRDESLNARNAFAPVLGPEQYRRFGFNSDGPLRKGKTSLSINIDGNNNYDSETINAILPGNSKFSDVVRRPEERMFGVVRLDHQLTPSQLLRVELRSETDTRDNLGVGNRSLADRAYTRDRDDRTLRFSLNGLLLPKVSNELKIQFGHSRTQQSSFSADPAVIVLDNFETGGAGQETDRRSRLLEVEDNVDWQVGKKHRMRAGLLVESDWYTSNELTNGNGTFTFGSLEQYELGIATVYSLRTGSTLVDYSHLETGVYLQDDWTPSKKLSISFGVRQEAQTHLRDAVNVAPRVGFSWTPGKYTVRGGYGLFYDWYQATYYEQTLRVNGVTQQDLVIQNASYPDPTGGAIGTALPPSRIIESADLRMPYLHQASIGIERTVFQTLRLMATYTMLRGRNQFRSVNLNAPIETDLGFVRPDPTLGNITQLESTGRSQIDRLMMNLNFAKPEKRFFMGMNYTLSRVRNFADNPFSLPANNYDLDAEWGPSAQDVRHRVFGMVNFGLPKGVRMGVFTQAQSASPYNIITGFDANRDTVINDRPAGVGRNAGRGVASWNLNTRLSRAISFGPQRQTTGQGGGPQIRRVGGGGGGGGGGREGAGGGGPMMMMMDGNDQRYRLEFYLQAFNILNRTNLTAFSGNLRSASFGQPNSAGPARRIEVGMNFGF